MIDISNFYDKTIIVHRLSEIEDTDKEQYAIHLSSVLCLIQEVEDAFSEDQEGGTGKNYMMYCDVVDIKETDRIIDGSDIYKVVGVKKLKFLGEDHHLEVVIRKYNA